MDEINDDGDNMETIKLEKEIDEIIDELEPKLEIFEENYMISEISTSKVCVEIYANRGDPTLEFVCATCGRVDKCIQKILGHLSENYDTCGNKSYLQSQKVDIISEKVGEITLDNTYNFACFFCYEVFHDMNMILPHLEIHVSKNVEDTLIEDTDLDFSKKLIDVFMAPECSNNYLFVCATCNQKRLTYEAITAHLESKKGICDNININIKKEPIDDDSLERTHRKASEIYMNNEGTLDYLCIICSLHFECIQLLQKHIYYHSQKQKNVMYNVLKESASCRSEEIINMINLQANLPRQFAEKSSINSRTKTPPALLSSQSLPRTNELGEKTNSAKTSNENCAKSGQNKTYKCDLCCKTLCTKYYLRDHFNIIHSIKFSSKDDFENMTREDLINLQQLQNSKNKELTPSLQEKNKRLLKYRKQILTKTLNDDSQEMLPISNSVSVEKTNLSNFETAAVNVKNDELVNSPNNSSNRINYDEQLNFEVLSKLTKNQELLIFKNSPNSNENSKSRCSFEMNGTKELLQLKNLTESPGGRDTEILVVPDSPKSVENQNFPTFMTFLREFDTNDKSPAVQKILVIPDSPKSIENEEALNIPTILQPKEQNQQSTILLNSHKSVTQNDMLNLNKEKLVKSKKIMNLQNTPKIVENGEKIPIEINECFDYEELLNKEDTLKFKGNLRQDVLKKLLKIRKLSSNNSDDETISADEKELGRKGELVAVGLEHTSSESESSPRKLYEFCNRPLPNIIPNINSLTSNELNKIQNNDDIQSISDSSENDCTLNDLSNKTESQDFINVVKTSKTKENIRESDEPLKCNICGKSLCNRFYLKKHEIRCNEKKKNKYVKYTKRSIKIKSVPISEFFSKNYVESDQNKNSLKKDLNKSAVENPNLFEGNDDIPGDNNGEKNPIPDDTSLCKKDICICERCHKEYSRKDFHSCLRKFKCKEKKCRQRFDTAFELTQHLQDYHMKLMPLKQSVCFGNITPESLVNGNKETKKKYKPKRKHSSTESNSSVEFHDILCKKQKIDETDDQIQDQNKESNNE